MTGAELKILREQLGLSQSDMARALNVSFATVNRWEKGHVQIPIETARLLECFQDVVRAAKKRKTSFDINDLREAAVAVGIAGVVASAATTTSLIAPGLVAALALTAPFAWIGGIAGLGLAIGLPFFKKLSRSKVYNKPRPKNE